MLLDNTLIFSEEQAITSTAVSTNVLDQGAKGDAYQALWLVVNVKEDFAGLTDLTVQIETDSDEAFGTAKIVGQSAPIELADLKAGETVVKMRMPVGLDRYIRLNYEVTGSASAGKVNAFLTAMPPIE